MGCNLSWTELREELSGEEVTEPYQGEVEIVNVNQGQFVSLPGNTTYQTTPVKTTNQREGKWCHLLSTFSVLPNLHFFMQSCRMLGT